MLSEGIVNIKKGQAPQHPNALEPRLGDSIHAGFMRCLSFINLQGHLISFRCEDVFVVVTLFACKPPRHSPGNSRFLGVLSIVEEKAKVFRASIRQLPAIQPERISRIRIFFI